MFIFSVLELINFSRLIVGYGKKNNELNLKVCKLKNTKEQTMELKNKAHESKLTPSHLFAERLLGDLQDLSKIVLIFDGNCTRFSFTK